MPAARSNPERETLMMLISAYLDGELSPAEEAHVRDALAQDPELLSYFESLPAEKRLGTALSTRLSFDDADALTASILAATTNGVPDTVAGAMQLASVALDGCLDDRGSSHLDALLEKPAAAAAVAGFVASSEAVQVAARAVAHVSAVQATLAALPDHVAATIALHERIGVLSSAALDGALTPSESSELETLLPRAPEAALAVLPSAHVGEALRVASLGPAFADAAARAGQAALHVIEAERLQSAAAAPAAAAAAASAQRPSLLARALQILRSARAPLAFAMAGAAALFFVVNDPPPKQPVDPKEALFWELAAAVDLEPVKKAEMPLLADNSADLEALDATATTMIFATENSNITVIWLAAGHEDAAEQGT